VLDQVAPVDGHRRDERQDERKDRLSDHTDSGSACAATPQWGGDPMAT
jgi:hypothetical protein